MRQSGKVRFGGKENDTKGKGMIGRQQVQQGGGKYDRERKRKKFGAEKFKTERTETQKGTN